jgi:hypothetical protein
VDPDFGRGACRRCEEVGWARALPVLEPWFDGYAYREVQPVLPARTKAPQTRYWGVIAYSRTSGPRRPFDWFQRVMWAIVVLGIITMGAVAIGLLTPEPPPVQQHQPSDLDKGSIPASSLRVGKAGPPGPKGSSGADGQPGLP